MKHDKVRHLELLKLVKKSQLIQKPLSDENFFGYIDYDLNYKKEFSKLNSY